MAQTSPSVRKKRKLWTKKPLQTDSSGYTLDNSAKIPEATSMVQNYEEDLKGVESRLETRIVGSLDRIEKTFERLDARVEKLSDKMDTTIKWLIGFCLTTILGVSAIAVAILVALS
jgi:hypothetical protein